MEYPWIDTYAHISVIEALKPARLNELPLVKNIKGLLSRYQAKLNRHTHLLGVDLTKPTMKWVSNALFGSSLPLSALQTEADLLYSMRENNVLASFVINLEPFSTHQHLLEVCELNPSLYPIVNLGQNYARLEECAKSSIERGAIGFAIHPILEKLSPASPAYFDLAEIANNYGVPLVCRTGVTHYLANDFAHYGEIERFRKLVEAFPHTQFVMSHSSLAQYRDAIEFARAHENVILDSVWQNAFSFKEIYRALGPSRLLFGSDSPTLGEQQTVQVRMFQALKFPEKVFEEIAILNPKRIYKRFTNRFETSSIVSEL